MNKEQQRIAIAEACGWEFVNFNYLLNGVWQNVTAYPDYLNDLNAMHDAEKTLFQTGRYRDYESALIQIMGKNFRGGEPFLWHATAEQRAEAFLKTIGKWTT